MEPSPSGKYQWRGAWVPSALQYGQLYITVDSQGENRLKMDGLSPDTNYSFQILASTGKGDGTSSANYFAKTGINLFWT